MNGYPKLTDAQERYLSAFKKLVDDFKAYVTPQFNYDPFFIKFDFDYEGLWFENNPFFGQNEDNILRLEYSSTEEVFSKRLNRTIMVDFYLYYILTDPNKGMAWIDVKYYDIEETINYGYELLEATKLEPCVNVDQAIALFRKVLQDDIRFLNDGDSFDPEPVPEPELRGVK